MQRAMCCRSTPVSSLRSQSRCPVVQVDAVRIPGPRRVSPLRGPGSRGGSPVRLGACHVCIRARLVDGSESGGVPVEAHLRTGPARRAPPSPSLPVRSALHCVARSQYPQAVSPPARAAPCQRRMPERRRAVEPIRNGLAASQRVRPCRSGRRSGAGFSSDGHAGGRALHLTCREAGSADAARRPTRSAPSDQRR